MFDNEPFRFSYPYLESLYIYIYNITIIDIIIYENIFYTDYFL
jgi:hypothetical protein